MSLFGASVRIIHAGHPQSNGQAEKYVGILKEKMKAIMAEVGNHFFFVKKIHNQFHAYFFFRKLLNQFNTFFLSTYSTANMGPNYFSYSIDGTSKRSILCYWLRSW